MGFWLLKSEPTAFSIDDLKSSRRKTTVWDGVRNYQARNFMRDEMEVGDLAFFYHSNCPETGIVGIVEVVKKAYPDPSAFDPKDKYFDPKSKPEKPTWYGVDVRFKRKFRRVIGLAELKNYADSKLKDFRLLRRGNRLSVMPVPKKYWDFIVGLE